MRRASIVLEEVAELLPWQLRSRSPTQRVQRTFMFTDIAGSTSLLEAMGDEAWQSLLSWHDKTLRSLFGANRGEEVTATGDGFFVAFESPDDALACAVAIQRDLASHRASAAFAPQVRIGVHASDATMVGRNFTGKGVHEAARIGALAEGGQIVASAETAAGGQFLTRDPRTVTVKGISDPIEVVTVDWR
jgi:class 3 adenylate cyclase